MAEKKPWTPDQPLPDEEAETEVYNESMKERRRRFLIDQDGKPPEPKGGKTKKWGE